MAQRYRGPVGTNSGGTIGSGVSKNYVYDQRLKYQAPPKFLDPVAASWGIAVWKEVTVAAGVWTPPPLPWAKLPTAPAAGDLRSKRAPADRHRDVQGTSQTR